MDTTLFGEDHHDWADIAPHLPQESNFTALCYTDFVTASTVATPRARVSLAGAATSIIFEATTVLSRQTRVRRDKHTFVATKDCFVARSPWPDITIPVDWA